MASYVRHTDEINENFLPTMDVADRAGFMKVTDGTNTQPTMDAAGRAGFMKITNGTYNADINSSGCLMTCPGTTSKPLTFSASEAKANRLFMTTGDFAISLKNVAYPGLLFKNPSGSGVEMYIKNITLANLTAAGHVFCRIYSNPTITNAGTNTTVNTTCANIGAASSSIFTTDTSITYSNIGIHLLSNVSFNEQVTLDFDFGIILQPNTQLLFVFESSANSQTVTSNITFSQVAL